MYDDNTQDLAIQSWVRSLDREGVPHQAYCELYERALASRAIGISKGKDVKPFGVEFLVAEWIGEHGLKAELREREIAKGRTLAANAESVCSLCNGSGWKTVGEGRNAPVAKCDHQ